MNHLTLNGQRYLIYRTFGRHNIFLVSKEDTFTEDDLLIIKFCKIYDLDGSGNILKALQAYPTLEIIPMYKTHAIIQKRLNPCNEKTIFTRAQLHSLIDQIAAIHNENFILGDIKFENIVMDDAGNVYLIDLDSAFYADGIVGKDIGSYGTPKIGHKDAKDGILTWRADLYAFLELFPNSKRIADFGRRYGPRDRIDWMQIKKMI